MEYEESELVEKGPCSDCGSSDACAVYSDGHTHCFSCGQTRQGTGNTPTHRRLRVSDEFLTGEVRALGARGIEEKTCQKFGYMVGKDRAGRTVQIANYRDA